MRTTLSARALGALLLTWGCGGNVVVDGSSAGSGGSTPGTGGTGTSSSSGPTSSGPTSSSATSSSTGGSSVTCDFACGGPIGLCGCGGPCSDGKMRAIVCGTTESGSNCTCDVDGQVVGMCNEPTLVCGFVGSCCGIVFGL